MRRTQHTLSFYFIIFLILASAPNAEAQVSSPPDSVNFAFLPAISFNSDLGLIGGGLANWYVYKDQHVPFHRYISLAAIASTKGLASFDLFVDKPFAFDTKFRLSYQVYVARFFEDPYFGVGNYTRDVYDQDPGVDNYFSFRSFNSGLDVQLRYPLTKRSKFGQLDLKATALVHYETPWDNSPDQVISVSPPPGNKGTHLALWGTGLTWENRDSEFRTTRGTYGEFNIQIGSDLLGSSGNSFIMNNDLRSFFTFHLIKDITLANRLLITHTNGDIPYWKLAYAGDEETLRGYPARRFLDDNAVIFNTELRTWLFELPMLESQFGGTLFFDAGRTFPNSLPLKDLTSDLRYTFGFGGLASFFTPDFIIRADIGFSEEDFGIYFTTGYMF